MPLSGAAGGEFTGDILLDLRRPWIARKFQAEVKGRRDGEGFKTLFRWLVGNDLLFLVKDRTEPLVVMNFSTLEKLLGGGGECQDLGG